MPRDNSDLLPLFAAAGEKYGIDPTLLMAVAKQESGLNPNTPDSYQGAQGLMQILPSTARGLGITNPRDPAQAIPAAAAYLREGFDKTGTPEGAIMYYHGGPDTRQWGPKTRAYLPAVAGHYANMKKQEPDPYADIYKEFSGALQSQTDKPAAAVPDSKGDPYGALYKEFSQALSEPQKLPTEESPEDAGQRSIAANVMTPPQSTARGGEDTYLSRSWEGLKKAGQTLPGYIGGQIAKTPGQIATNAGQAYEMAKAGISDISQGSLLPSGMPSLAIQPGGPTGGFNSVPYPDTPPSSNFNPGGLLGTALGVVGVPGSLVSGPARTLVGEPVTQATGSQRLGAGAEAAANVIGGQLALGGARMPGGAADPETLRLAQAADAWGIPVRASQISTNPLVRKTDQMVGIIPGSGQGAQRAAQTSGFTRAVSNTFGEDTPQITRRTLETAQDRIGGVMNDVEGRTTVVLDQPMIDRFANLEGRLRQALGPDDPNYRKIAAQLDDIFSKAAANNGTLPGESWKALTTHKSPLNLLADASDATLSRPASEILDTLRDGIQRSAAPGDAEAYARARFQYKNMKTVEPLVTKGTPGEISPALLRGRVDAQFDPRRAGPLGDLADIGQRFMRAPPDSGTPYGTLVLNALTEAPGKVAAGLVAGGGLGGHLLGFGPSELLQGAAGAAAAGLTARGVTSLLNNPLYRQWLLRRAPGTGNEIINPP